MTISYDELVIESNLFIQFLLSKGVEAYRDNTTFRDYNVKIKNIFGQSIFLYHKPSKKTFSIGVHEVKDPSLKAQIEQLWQEYKYPNQSAITGLCAYVDGSYYNGKIGWGIAIVLEGELIFSKGGKLNLSAEEGSRQIAGEVQAVIEALEYADSHQYKEITILYDYMGLQKWADREWKVNSVIAQFYVAKLLQFRHIKITWHKVKAHTGNKFNEIADQLAKGLLPNSF